MENAELTLKNIELFESEDEESLYKIWSDVLSNDDIKRDDKFFEIGGNSLTAMMMIERVKSEFNCELNAAQLMECNTIPQLLNLINEYRLNKVSEEVKNIIMIIAKPRDVDEVEENAEEYFKRVDSLVLIELFTAVENKYSIEIPTELMMEIRTDDLDGFINIIYETIYKIRK